jgi:hypothetical protein
LYFVIFVQEGIVSSTKGPLFKLGEVVATPGALKAVQDHPRFLTDILERHRTGDWGECNSEDRQTNDDALVHRERLLSVYTAPNGEKVWVITEADRSSTTVLLPDEY